MSSFEDLLNTPPEELPEVDEIGAWSLIKLEIIKEYAQAYSLILDNVSKTKEPRFSHVYIDAFSGPGIAKDKNTDKLVLGSPLIALEVSRPFKHYYFIELDDERASFLREKTAHLSNVSVETGDCNEVLIKRVFPKVRYSDFLRGLCLFDPKGLHLNWNVLLASAKEKSIEVFVNFPLMDMNMNALWRKNPLGQNPAQIERMNSFWGDDSWRGVIYETEGDLFGYPSKVNGANKKIADAYRIRLKEVAGFKHVPEPILMRNTSGGELYYLFFASHNETGYKIAKHILMKYQDLV